MSRSHPTIRRFYNIPVFFSVAKFGRISHGEQDVVPFFECFCIQGSYAVQTKTDNATKYEHANIAALQAMQIDEDVIIESSKRQMCFGGIVVRWRVEHYVVISK